MFRLCLSRTFRTVKQLQCASWPVTKQISIQIFHLFVEFSDIHPSMVICQNKIQCVTLAKSFLCSFKFRQLVLLCQTNRYENPDPIFYRFFFEFLQTFFAKAREFIEHILWEILKVICAFRKWYVLSDFVHAKSNLVKKILKSLFCGEVVRSEMIETLHET